MKKRLQELQELSESLTLPEPVRAVQRPRTGWLRAVRTALGMPQSYLARELGVTTGAIAKYEAGEAAGSISLATLRKAANAMEYDLVYALVPRTSMDEIRFGRARVIARKILGAASRKMALKDQKVPKGDLETRIDDLARVILTQHENALWSEEYS
jgi:predicted DNA-binding mobile mystery protein A